MEDIVIYPSRLKMSLIALGALAFVIAGIFIGTREEVTLTPLKLFLATYVGIPFFGLCFLFAAYKLLVRKPAIIISNEGLVDNASAVGAGFLRWEEIEEIFVHEYVGQRMLGIVVKDPVAVIARQSGFKKAMAKLNGGVVGTSFNIPQVSLPMPVEELLSTIETYRSAVGSHSANAQSHGPTNS